MELNGAEHGILHRKWRESKEYKKMRHELLSRHHNRNIPVKCKICGIKAKGNYASLHHFNDGYLSFDDYVNPKNVIVVCGSCHAELHGKILEGYRFVKIQDEDPPVPECGFRLGFWICAVCCRQSFDFRSVFCPFWD